MDSLISDNSTKPLQESSIRQTGRPSTRRKEKRTIPDNSSQPAKKQCTKQISGSFFWTIMKAGQLILPH